MILMPKFLKEFPENITSVVEDDIMPISRANEDDSYKITTQKLRDDVLGQPLVGIKRPYIYGDSHYTVAAGTIVYDGLHGPNALTCSSNTDFETIMPGYLCRTTDPSTPEEYRTVISKDYTAQYLIVDSEVTSWTSSRPFVYSNSRFALVSTSGDVWRPVSGESTLRGLVHEHTYFDYEPAKSDHVLISRLSVPINLVRNEWMLLSLDNVEWNNFGEWNQASKFFRPLYDGLYKVEVLFTILVSSFTPGDYYILVLSPTGFPTDDELFYVQSYPSTLTSIGISVNFSSMLTMEGGRSYSWYIKSSAERSSIDQIHPAIISIKRERSMIGRTYDRS